jgi:hypothetical protein
MEEMKISDIYDPMELSNGLVQLLSDLQDDDYLVAIYHNAKELSEEVMSHVGSNSNANRGVAIFASALMTFLVDVEDLLDNREDTSDFYEKFCTVGLPSLLLHILSSENIVAAKNELEGILEL